MRPFSTSTLAGAVTQILATAFMLAAMRQRSFSVVTAYIKTEPVQTAIFGLVLLGDPLTPQMAAAIGIATAGVLLMSTKPGAALTSSGLRPVILGVGAGALFRAFGVGFRSAILSLTEGSFLIRATTTLVWSLGVQTAILVVWLLVFDRKALVGSLLAWRPSLGAGFLGALASQFWFLGFALTTRRQCPHARARRGRHGAGRLAKIPVAGNEPSRTRRDGAHRSRSGASSGIAALRPEAMAICLVGAPAPAHSSRNFSREDIWK